VGDNRNMPVRIDIDGECHYQTNRCQGQAVRSPKTGQEIFTFNTMAFVKGRGTVSFESMLVKSLK
jgi:hypothetical protein